MEQCKTFVTPWLPQLVLLFLSLNDANWTSPSSIVSLAISQSVPERLSHIYERQCPANKEVLVLIESLRRAQIWWKMQTPSLINFKRVSGRKCSNRFPHLMEKFGVCPCFMSFLQAIPLLLSSSTTLRNIFLFFFFWLMLFSLRFSVLLVHTDACDWCWERKWRMVTC